jgi:hypothetical protein
VPAAMERTPFLACHKRNHKGADLSVTPVAGAAALEVQQAATAATTPKEVGGEEEEEEGIMHILRHHRHINQRTPGISINQPLLR